MLHQRPDPTTDCPDVPGGEVIDSTEPLPLEASIDRIELHLAIGQWRGRLKVGEFAPPNALLLFAKDDGQPLPWGRALEELLASLLAKAGG